MSNFTLKVISGGQTGADLAGLWAAKCFEIPTGGEAPRGYRTIIGDRPCLGSIFNLSQSVSSGYAKRTEANVVASDLTILACGNFNSPGSNLTAKHCIQHGVPVFLVQLENSYYADSISRLVNDAAKMILNQSLIKSEIVINIAGNSTKSCSYAFDSTFIFCYELFEVLGFEPLFEPALNKESIVYEMVFDRLTSKLKDRYEPANLTNIVLGIA